MAKTGAERQRDYVARKQEQNLTVRTVWLSPAQVPKFDAFVKKLKESKQ